MSTGAVLPVTSGSSPRVSKGCAYVVVWRLPALGNRDSAHPRPRLRSLRLVLLVRTLGVLRGSHGPVFTGFRVSSRPGCRPCVCRVGLVRPVALPSASQLPRPRRPPPLPSGPTQPARPPSADGPALLPAPAPCPPGLLPSGTPSACSSGTSSLSPGFGRLPHPLPVSRQLLLRWNAASRTFYDSNAAKQLTQF